MSYWRLPAEGGDDPDEAARWGAWRSRRRIVRRSQVGRRLSRCAPCPLAGEQPELLLASLVAGRAHKERRHVIAEADHRGVPVWFRHPRAGTHIAPRRGRVLGWPITCRSFVALGTSVAEILRFPLRPIDPGAASPFGSLRPRGGSRSLVPTPARA